MTTVARPSVLVVDDEACVLESIARTLDEEFDVHTANGTVPARDVLRQGWIQAVLFGQRMPDMTGVEFLRELGEEWPDVVRIIISGYTDAEDIVDGVNRAGIYQYLTKP